MQYESLTKRRLFRKSKTEILLTSIEAMEGAFALNRELLISFKLKEGYGRLLLLVYLLHFYKIPIRTNIAQHIEKIAQMSEESSAAAEELS